MNVDTGFFQLLHEKRSVTDVCVRAQGISHFYYVYFFAKVTQNGSKFAAYQTASENDDLLTYLLCLEVVILGYYHFAALSKTRDRRHSRGTSGGYDKGIRRFLLYIISPYPGVQADLNAGFSGQELVCFSQLIHFIFRRQSRFSNQQSSAAVSCLAQNNLVTSAGSCVCGVQAAGTSAHHEDLPFYWCRLYFSKTFIFSSNQRVNGTTAGKCAGPFCHAGEAAEEKHLLDYTRWTEDYNDEIKERVLRNDLDAAFVIGRINSERIYEEKIFSRPLSAVFYPGHRLYNREFVEMRELEGEKLITLNERFYSYHAIVKRCSETGFTPDIRIKTMEGQLIYKFTAERQGTGIDVDFHRSTPWSQDLRTVEIEDSIPWTVFAVCPVDKKDDPRIKELLDYYRGICLR